MQAGFLIMILPGEAQLDVSLFALMVLEAFRFAAAKAVALPAPDLVLLFIRTYPRRVEMIAGQVGGVPGDEIAVTLLFDFDLYLGLIVDPDGVAQWLVVFIFGDQLATEIIKIAEGRGFVALVQSFLGALSVMVVMIVGDQPVFFVHVL